MNIYVRYFNNEALVRNLDELLDFLSGLGDIVINKAMVDELSDYLNDESSYPKRYKVRPRVYFILIKTLAQSLDEFKAHNKPAMAPQPSSGGNGYVRKDSRVFLMQEPNEGWYLGRINFKRVLLIPGTQKFQYRDTTFAAYVHAESAMHCYARIIDHLKNRQDVDPRSQFPSAKGSNFTYEFFGDRLPQS